MEAGDTTMEVYDIGTKVLIGGDIPAFISAISVRGAEHYLIYECVYWDERERKAAWLTPQEIMVADLTKTRMLALKVKW